jgi:hypothetical protein
VDTTTTGFDHTFPAPIETTPAGSAARRLRMEQPRASADRRVGRGQADRPGIEKDQAEQDRLLRIAELDGYRLNPWQSSTWSVLSVAEAEMLRTSTTYGS